MSSRREFFNPVKLAVDIFLDIRKELEVKAREIAEGKIKKGEVSKENAEEEIGKIIESDLGPKLRARAREMPELIEDVGLIPALSFCYAKAKGEDYESIAYGEYLTAILKYIIDKLGLLNISVEEAKNDPAKTLEELFPLSSVALSLLRPFLVEFKRLCEATWRKEVTV